MWFDVDKQGLANILARKGKSFALYELLGNAWDAEATQVQVSLEPIDGQPYARLIVEDNSPKGWASLQHAYSMFAPSSRAADSSKRGRFNLGEKLVLACCRTAYIQTMQGSITFSKDNKRSQSATDKRALGTLFVCEIKMTRDELEQARFDMSRIIPPVPTSFNGQELYAQFPTTKVTSFEAKLPTEIADEDQLLRRTVRQTKVEVYQAMDGIGRILEMGIPVCEVDMPWCVNVLQKIPLNMERDEVTTAFRRALQVAVVNKMATYITEEQSQTTWASEALEDARIEPDAVQEIVTKRFGDRAVIAVPGDPIANAQAEAAGCQVIHGGSLSAGAWANVRKLGTVPTTSVAFPSPRPMNKPSQQCPTCGQVVRV